tara:strand:+ start:673 stop:1161 length:489 start_codon:yes stop_codon:yes gene_type:complete
LAPTKHSRDDFAPFDTQRTLPIALLRAREAVMDRFRPMLRGIDVTEQQWRVLRVVQEEGEIDATHLARAASVLAPTLTRILKTLESRDLITLRTDTTDRRRTQVSISTTGQTVLRDAGQISAQIHTEIEARLGAERIADLVQALEKAADDLNENNADETDVE